jgi:hypothetical protein
VVSKVAAKSAVETGEEASAAQASPGRDASMIDSIVERIKNSNKDWIDPPNPIEVGGLRWRPDLVSGKSPIALHVHIDASVPKWVERRLHEAAKQYRICVALPIEALYDDAVLRLLSDINAYVIVVSRATVSKPAHYLAAIADNGIAVGTQLRIDLASRCWSKRREGSNFEKGRLFEALIAFLLSQVGSFRIESRNFNGATDEIDIVVRVAATTKFCWSESGVPFVIVEAKNWKDTVGSVIVSSLIRKLETRRGRARIGLLFVTSSFSPEAQAEELKEAKGALCVAMLGPNDIEKWIAETDLAAYLDKQISRAMLR